MPGRRRRRGSSLEKHVRLYRWMTDSEAWQDLSAGGRALLVVLYGLYNGENNGALFLSVRDAAKATRVTKDTAARYFAELAGHGFIRAKSVGSFNRKNRHASCWILTEFEYASQLPTKDFMRWRRPQKSKAGPEYLDQRSP